MFFGDEFSRLGASLILWIKYRSKHMKAFEQLDDGCDTFKMGITTLCTVLLDMISLNVGHLPGLRQQECC